MMVFQLCIVLISVYYLVLLGLFLHQWCSLNERFQLSTLIIKLTNFNSHACNRPLGLGLGFRVDVTFWGALLRM